MTANGSDASSTGKGALNWPTVALIVATGAGNLFTTQHGNVTISAEQQEGLSRIRELHSEIDDFKRWQNQAIENQNDMMKNDTRLLEEVHQVAVRLDRLKNLDQMRGAPGFETP